MHDPLPQLNFRQTMHNLVNTQTDLTETFALNGHDLDYNFDEHDTSPPPSSSHYYLEKQFTHKFLLNTLNDFSVLHFNIRSISNFVYTLSLLLENCHLNCSVIGLTDVACRLLPPSLFNSRFRFCYK